jgi:hypothetical protein
VTDWTVILTAVGASAVSGTFGYLAARQGAKASIRQAETQHATALAQIEAENARLREQHKEDHLRNRQGTYHRFLNVESEFRGKLERGEVTHEDFRDFHAVGMGVEIFGARPVRDISRQVVAGWRTIVEELNRRTREEGEDLRTAAKAALAQHDPAMNNLRGELYEAMRADIAADV